MAVQLYSTQGANLGAGVKVLVIGPPGAGKTRLSATLPNPVIISAERGLLSLRDKNLPFVQITKLSELDEVRRWLATSAEARKFASVAVDSISEIAETVLAYELSRTKDGRAAYGNMAREVMEIVKGFRDLTNHNVYVIAKQERIAIDGGNNSIYGPMMPGKTLTADLPFQFDIVMQLVPMRHTDGTYYSALRTRGTHEGDVVKDRSGSLAEWEMPEPGSDIPNLGALFNKINGKV